MILINLREILGLVALVLLGFGVLYAAIIYYRPFPPGWTWVSVVVGDLVNDFGVGAAILATVVSAGYWELWWMALLPAVGHILDGGPMIVGQILKWAAQKRRNRKLDRELE